MKPCEQLARLIHRKKLHGLFITGTDTHVGKTFLTALLVQRLRELGLDAVAMKPVACGACGLEDAKLYARLAGGRERLRDLNPYAFALPLAPVAQRSSIRVSTAKIQRAYQRLRSRHDLVLAEGAGGLLVPITWSISVRELARSIGAPVLIVARAGLGTLNHTLLTVEAAKRSGLKIFAIVLNDWDGKKIGSAPRNRRVLGRMTRVPVFILRHSRDGRPGIRASSPAE